MKSLREWRAEKLMTIRDLAARANVANQTIVQIEHGRISPRLRTMRRLSEALEVEPAEISEFDDAIKRATEPADTGDETTELPEDNQAAVPHRLQPLLDTLPVDSFGGVASDLAFGFLLDKQGDVLYVSAGHARVLGDEIGWERGADIFDTFIQFVHPDDQYDTMRLIHYLLVTPGAVDEVSLRLRSATGGWRDMRLHGANLLDHPAIEAVLLTASAASSE
jgi:transcriptional regulator with XRE-family HTH domain